MSRSRKFKAHLFDLLCLLPFLATFVGSRILKPPYTYEERLEEYHKGGHARPISEYVPNTEGWSRLISRRISQIQAIEHDLMSKWNGFLETLGPTLTTPNFTEFGWGLTRAPQDLIDDVRQAIYKGLPNARLEAAGFVNSVEGPIPLFIED
jgi:hypothetical protein